MLSLVLAMHTVPKNDGVMPVQNTLTLRVGTGRHKGFGQVPGGWDRAGHQPVARKWPYFPHLFSSQCAAASSPSPKAPLSPPPHMQDTGSPAPEPYSFCTSTYSAAKLTVLELGHMSWASYLSNITEAQDYIRDHVPGRR